MWLLWLFHHCIAQMNIMRGSRNFSITIEQVRKCYRFAFTSSSYLHSITRSLAITHTHTFSISHLCLGCSKRIKPLSAEQSCQWPSYGVCLLLFYFLYCIITYTHIHTNAYVFTSEYKNKSSLRISCFDVVHHKMPLGAG